jgi:hypothetical protein
LEEGLGAAAFAGFFAVVAGLLVVAAFLAGAALAGAALAGAALAVAAFLGGIVKNGNVSEEFEVGKGGKGRRDKGTREERQGTPKKKKKGK